MASTATVTGVVGPAVMQTALVYTNVTSFSLDTNNEVLSLVSNGVVYHVDISAATTLTLTVSGSAYTLTVS